MFPSWQIIEKSIIPWIMLHMTFKWLFLWVIITRSAVDMQTQNQYKRGSKLYEQMICGNDCVICVMKWILWINFTIGTSSAISTNKCNKYQIMFKVSTFPHSNCWKWKAFWWIEEKNWIVIHLVAENACEEIEMEYDIRMEHQEICRDFLG